MVFKCEFFLYEPFWKVDNCVCVFCDVHVNCDKYVLILVAAQIGKNICVFVVALVCFKVLIVSLLESDEFVSDFVYLCDVDCEVFV